MKFLITGLNHKTAPVEVRERLAFSEQSLPAALADLTGREGLLEAMILSTCNRVEVVVTADDATDVRGQVTRFLAEMHGVAPDWVAPFLYHHEGQEAVHHLFRVASSLDSMVVGEPQILGQLKAAYTLAKEHGALNGFIELMMTRAFSVAKRVRTETEIGENAVSVSYAAVELAREIFGSLAGKKVLIAGAGKMAAAAVRHLRRAGVTDFYVTNRTAERAIELAKEFQGKVVDYERFPAMLPETDIVIASSGAPHYILTKDQMKKVSSARRSRPMFLIDIAVPRNIDPTVNSLEGVFLYDIDDLEKVVDSNRQGRQHVAQQAEDIIREEVDKMMARLKAREVAPMIVSLQEQLEQVRQAELERIKSKLGGLTPQQMEAIEALTRGIINKIAHGPIAELRRQATEPEGPHVANVIRKVFRLGE